MAESQADGSIIQFRWMLGKFLRVMLVFVWAIVTITALVALFNGKLVGGTVGLLVGVAGLAWLGMILWRKRES